MKFIWLPHWESTACRRRLGFHDLLGLVGELVKCKWHVATSCDLVRLPRGLQFPVGTAYWICTVQGATGEGRG